MIIRNAQCVYRAKAFANFLHDKVVRLISEGFMHGGDHPFSMFEGIAGLAYLLLDLNDPSHTRCKFVTFDALESGKLTLHTLQCSF